MAQTKGFLKMNKKTSVKDPDGLSFYSFFLNFFHPV